MDQAISSLQPIQPDAGPRGEIVSAKFVVLDSEPTVALSVSSCIQEQVLEDEGVE